MPTKTKLKNSLDKTKLMSKLVIDILQKQVEDHIYNHLEVNYELRNAMLKLERRYHYEELSLRHQLGIDPMGYAVGKARAIANLPQEDSTVRIPMGFMPVTARRKDVYKNKINYYGEPTGMRREHHTLIDESLAFQPEKVMAEYKWKRNSWAEYYKLMGWPLDKHRRS